ncbi:MAG TPA: DUF2203 domain-containing protein [Ignavibacteria bacterium]
MEYLKHFTLTEARDKLDELKPIIRKMIDLKNVLDEKGFDIYRHQYFGGTGINGTGKHPKELDELVNCVKKISGEGVVIKGIENGLIDFPHIRANGEEVFLCYLYGESDINHWHSLSEGFKGRRKIAEL